jgi:hypothetical protein
MRSPEYCLLPSKRPLAGAREACGLTVAAGGAGWGALFRTSADARGERPRLRQHRTSGFSCYGLLSVRVRFTELHDRCSSV